MTDDNPIRAFVGVFPIAHDVTIPAEVLARANDEIDRERARRRLAAEEQARAAEATRKPPSFLARVLAAIFFGRR